MDGRLDVLLRQIDDQAEAAAVEWLDKQIENNSGRLLEFVLVLTSRDLNADVVQKNPGMVCNLCLYALSTLLTKHRERQKQLEDLEGANSSES